MFSSLRHVASIQTKKHIAVGIFQSVMSYCLPLFGGCDKGSIKELQVLQNSAVRVVLNAHPRTSRSDLFEQVGWLSVNQLVAYHTLLMVFNIRRSGEPDYLARFLQNEQNDSKNFRIRWDNTKLSLALRSFTFRGAQAWNDLPFDVRACRSLNGFKKQTKKWIMVNIKGEPKKKFLFENTRIVLLFLEIFHNFSPYLTISRPTSKLRTLYLPSDFQKVTDFQRYMRLFQNVLLRFGIKQSVTE